MEIRSCKALCASAKLLCVTQAAVFRGLISSWRNESLCSPCYLLWFYKCITKSCTSSLKDWNGWWPLPWRPWDLKFLSFVIPGHLSRVHTHRVRANTPVTLALFPRSAVLPLEVWLESISHCCLGRGHCGPAAGTQDPPCYFGAVWPMPFLSFCLLYGSLSILQSAASGLQDLSWHPQLGIDRVQPSSRLVSARTATGPVKGKSDHVPSLSWACAPHSDTIHLPPVLVSSKHPSHSLAALSCSAPCLCPAVPFGPNLPFQVVSSYQLPQLSCDQPGQGTSAITHFPKPQGLSGSLQ